ncbi:MAG: RNA polymerase subunit sigma-24 [Asticcacaulis sp.]|nr:RNA polymerase subunit sigma-24 [Asticcacaulis sp.]
MDTGAAADAAARMAYGRLVAYLSARTRDIAAAEEALAAAFLRALETWPKTGVPARPEAWLLSVARNRLNDGWRRDRVRAEAVPTLELLMEEVTEPAIFPDARFPDAPFPDERLKLMFVCTHPAIDEGVRTPLMLQTVLGLSAERIASAFLVRAAAMGQRLSRAKAKIRDAGIPFEVPEPAAWPQRLPALLNAIYAAYGLGWGDYAGEDERRGLADEAIDLARTLHGLLPATAELNGLLALMLYCEARRAARFRDGAYVALDRQAPELWDWTMIDQANRLLNVIDPRALGRFRLEALIQSVHTRRAVTGDTDWTGIAGLYAVLLKVAPSLAAQAGYAVALTEAGRPDEGLGVLDGMDGERMAAYQPWWAARAHVLKRLGRRDEARAGYDRAMALTRQAAQRHFLTAERAGLG